MTKILVTYDMFREGFTELESKYEVTFPEGRDFTYEEVLEMIPEYDVLCSMFDFPVNKELIDHASKLKMVANYAVGYNNIDVAYCLEKGITVAGRSWHESRRLGEFRYQRDWEDIGYYRYGTYRKGPCQTCECLWHGSALS